MTRWGHRELPRLIVLTRYPTPGDTKTRLAPLLGNAGAAALHGELARHCVRRMHATALSGVASLEVHVAGAGPHQARQWLGRRVTVRPQAAGGLGERLAAAALGAFAAGAPSVVLVGSDAPHLGGDHVRAALRALADTDVVLGPALDGGYYLVAFGRGRAAEAVASLFGPDIPWGTATVLEASAAAARRAGLEVRLLDALADIDRPEDIGIWESLRAAEQQARRAPRTSVVIPAFDEDGSIGWAIESARCAGAAEIVVADGGSTDRTPDIAAKAGARVIRTGRGRARQLNAGADVASGDVLLFLHADTTLPPDALDHVRHAMADPDVALGSFRFSAGDPTSLLDRFISVVGDWRHRVFRLPYGDQAPFCRARDFADLGGFPDLPVMEDYELARRCSRLGRLASAPVPIRTSARSWHEHGLVRATTTNMLVIAGYRLGLPADALARWRGRVT